jgi:hypothetical protein
MTRQTTTWLLTAIVLSSAAGVHAQEYTPAYDRIRAGLHRDGALMRVVRETEVPPAGWPERMSTLRAAPSSPLGVASSSVQRFTTKRRGSFWMPVLVGAGVGGLAGGVWGRSQCDLPDPECTAIAVPVGVLGGAGIGAAVGAVVHAIRR